MDEKDLKRYYYTQLVIWISLVISVVIYLVVGKFFIGPVDVTREAADTEKLRYLFAVIAIMAPMANITLTKRILSSDTVDNLKGPRALTPYGLLNILNGAINESVAIFGLVLYLIAGDDFDLYAFIALSLAYHMMFMPKYSVLRNWAIHKELIPDDTPLSEEGRDYKK